MATIATLNVGTLFDQGNYVLDLIAVNRIDVLCLQETSMTLSGSSEMRTTLAKDGWKVFMGEARQGSDKHLNGGVVTISRWPMTLAASNSLRCTRTITSLRTLSSRAGGLFALATSTCMWTTLWMPSTLVMRSLMRLAKRWTTLFF